MISREELKQHIFRHKIPDHIMFSHFEYCNKVWSIIQSGYYSWDLNIMVNLSSHQPCSKIPPTEDFNLYTSQRVKTFKGHEFFSKILDYLEAEQL